MPTINHDVGYIPFDVTTDDDQYVICDSTQIYSGRNKIQYPGGSQQLREHLASLYQYKEAYQDFSGYIVVRFLVNCVKEFDRYRVQSLHLDFSRADAPASMVEHMKSIVKNIDSWIIEDSEEARKEYMKYVNLKVQNGRIQDVLL